jgi:hypothetical protein
MVNQTSPMQRGDLPARAELITLSVKRVWHDKGLLSKMSSGPITIFDKSFLQALSVDEAALFGQFYRTVITPLFFVETMADLEKEVKRGRTPEDVVGLIAAKAANLTADPNAHHRRLVSANLVGRHTLMDGRPHVVGGRSVKTADGRSGLVFDEAPEAEALHRWQRGQFLDVERMFAKQWREALREQQVRKLDVQQTFPGWKRPRTLEEVKRYAAAYVGRKGGPAFLSALNPLAIDGASRGQIFLEWLNCGAPPITVFAPYAAYVVTVQLFFELAVSWDLISGDRPSNAADIAYLFYLPFCMIFTSHDKLHAKTAPLFLRDDQAFVPGDALKSDLKRLDEHFSAQSQEILDRGVMYFDPPFDGDYLTTRLWRQFLPGWRDRRGKTDVPIRRARQSVSVDQLNEDIRAPEGAPIGVDDANFVAVQRLVPVTMGKWRILPQDVADRALEHQRRSTAGTEPDPVSASD